MRNWQVERRKRTRHLIELGGLIVKARIVEITSDDRALIYGALLWMADRLEGEKGEVSQEVWRSWGQAAFEMEPAEKTAKWRNSVEADWEEDLPLGG